MKKGRRRRRRERVTRGIRSHQGRERESWSWKRRDSRRWIGWGPKEEAREVRSRVPVGMGGVVGRKNCSGEGGRGDERTSSRGVRVGGGGGGGGVVVVVEENGQN